MVKTARWFTLFILKLSLSFQQLCITNNKGLLEGCMKAGERLKKERGKIKSYKI